MTPRRPLSGSSHALAVPRPAAPRRPLALAACDTAEERAEAHYQRAMALLAEGEVDAGDRRVPQRLPPRRRAHAAARLDYARLLRERGELGRRSASTCAWSSRTGATSRATSELAELALEVRDFATAETHADRAYELDPADPGDPRLQGHRRLPHGGDREAAVEMAEGVLAEAPGNVPAHMVLIADRMAAPATPPARSPLVDDGARPRARGRGPASRQARACSRGSATGRRSAPSSRGWPSSSRRTPASPGADPVAPAARRHRRRRAGAARRRPRPPPAARAGRAPTSRWRSSCSRPAAPTPRAPSSSGSPPAAADPRPYARALAGLDVAEGRTEAAIAALRAIIDGAEPSDETARHPGRARRDAGRDRRRRRRATRWSTRCSPRTRRMWRR